MAFTEKAMMWRYPFLGETMRSASGPLIFPKILCKMPIYRTGKFDLQI